MFWPWLTGWPLVILALAFANIADCLAALLNHSLAQGIGCFSVLQPYSIILLDGIVAVHLLHHSFPARPECSAELVFRRHTSYACLHP